MITKGSRGQGVKGLEFNLYLITDRTLTPDLIKAVGSALKGGCRAIQLREKDMGTRQLLELAYKLKELTSQYNARLFINDRLDIALSVEAEGIHLGQKGMPVRVVKKALAKASMLIGVSTHSLKEALSAQKDGADFITLGPIYETPSKLKYGKPLGIETLKTIKGKIRIPLFAIGGIKTDNIKEVISAGADGVAVISGILSSSDIRERTEEFLRLLR